MFVQVIRGKAKDAAALKRELDAWMESQRPKATGWIGSTSGVASDGQFVAIARFDNQANAMANSERPDQGDWWSRMEALLEGVTFRNSSDVVPLQAGGSDKAGFVQIMEGRAKDRAALEAVDAEFEKLAADGRPDVIGGLRIWFDDGTFVDSVYFTSEAEARKGEKQMASGDMAKAMEKFSAAADITEYIDLTEPWLSSP